MMMPLTGKGIASLVLASLVAMPLTAAAESWQEYNHPELGFAVSFPAEPTVTSGTYQTASGTVLPATIFSVRLDSINYSLTIADFSSASSEQASALDDAVKIIGRTGNITLDVVERVDQHYGHALTVTWNDGSVSSMAIFYFNNRLYQIDGRSFPPDPQSGSSATLRFNQSLQFSGTPGLPARGNGPGGRGGPQGGRRGPPPQAFADCVGKKTGDAVQHATPNGLVASTCIDTPQGLAARPDASQR